MLNEIMILENIKNKLHSRDIIMSYYPAKANDLLIDCSMYIILLYNGNQRGSIMFMGGADCCVQNSTIKTGKYIKGADINEIISALIGNDNILYEICYVCGKKKIHKGLKQSGETHILCDNCKGVVDND